jgi:hypothetical protein
MLTYFQILSSLLFTSQEKRELELKLLRKEQEMKTMQEQSEKNSSNMKLDKRNANQERRNLSLLCKILIVNRPSQALVIGNTG